MGNDMHDTSPGFTALKDVGWFLIFEPPNELLYWHPVQRIDRHSLVHDPGDVFLAHPPCARSDATTGA